MHKTVRLAILLPLVLAALACGSITRATPVTIVITLPASFTPAPSSTSSLTLTATPQAKVSPSATPLFTGTSTLVNASQATLAVTRTNTTCPVSSTPSPTTRFTSTPTNTTASQSTVIPATNTATHTATFTLPATFTQPAPTSTPTKTPLLPTATFTATQSPPTFTATTVLPTVTNTQTGCQPQSSDSLEDQLIALINAERSAQGIGLLTEQGQLAAAARGHSADMACNNFFGHTGSNGSGLAQRLSAQGYGYSAAAENIGAGYATAQEMFNGWMQSDGHRENMLNPAYSQVGVGYSFRAETQYGHYWTADFGSP